MIYTKPRSQISSFEPLTVTHVVFDNELLINEYLGWKRTHAPVAASRYKVWIERFQRFTNKAPEYLTIGDWTAFADTLDGCFAPKSVQYALNIIHNYLRFWQEQGRLRNLPLYLARVPKAIVASHNAIEENEYRQMIKILRDQGQSALRDLAIVMLLHDTGIRVGELMSLEIENIEEDASATIQSEKTVERRRVFWNRDTDDVLHQLIVERINSEAKSDWLFVPKNNSGEEKPLKTRSVQRMISRISKAAGISRKISPHSFRHGYIHRLAALSVPDAIIAQLVGHGSPHTISHYTKLSRPEFKEFAQKLFRRIPALAA